MTGSELARNGLPAAFCALHALWRAGVPDACFVTRHDGPSAELSRLFGARYQPSSVRQGRSALDLEYVTTAPTPSASHTLVEALNRPGVMQRPIALAFPDILFSPNDAFARVLQQLHDLMESRGGQRGGVVLGCFPAERPEKTDMVEIGLDGSLKNLVIKQADSGLEMTWQIAAWTPGFSRYLIARTQAWKHGDGELHVGRVLQDALRDGLPIRCVTFANGRCLDVGTPDDLRRAQTFAGEAN